MSDLLAIDGLRAGYGEAVVLSGMSLRLAEGHVLALLGRNGTGKTTLINSIVGITRRFGGSIAVGGRDITPIRPDQRGRCGIGWGAPEGHNLWLADGGREHDRGSEAGPGVGRESLRDVSATAGAAQQFR